MSTELHDLVNPAAEGLMPVVKAHFVGERNGTQSTLLVERDAVGSVFGQAGALTPAYDPHVLALIFENSSALRPNVDAYVANIDSFGHAYQPTIETTAADADEKIRDALRVERAIKKRDGRYAMDSDVFSAADEPTDDEVAARKKQLEKDIRTERALLGAFFDNCSVDIPFSGPEGLRGLTRQDIEVIGAGYWEVLRNDLNRVCQFNHIPAVSMRMMPLDAQVTEVTIKRRISLLSTEEVTVQKRFRRYVQTGSGVVVPGAKDVVYFKEFGDPRTISSKTGRVHASPEEMLKDQDEKDAVPATEILAFKISSPRSPYGVPRWIGALLAVMGTRQAEEVNFLYFENRSVPPMAILVSGGRLNDGTVERLQDYISTEIRGKRNFHKILILEAEGGETSSGQQTSHMKIEIRPLTEAQQKDANFQAYDERNEMKVGQSFRLPPILRGNIKDFNRSTAAASIDFAEIQVFGPIRQQFDWVMNKLLLELGAKYHTFKSNAPTVRDPEQLARMIALLHGANITTGDEARDLIQDVFNRGFDNLREDWSAKPFAIALAEANAKGMTGNEDFEEAGGMSAGNAGQSQRQAGVRQAPPKSTPPDREKPKPKSKDSVRAMAKASMVLQKTLIDAELGAMEEGGADELERVVIRVPQEEWEAWWKKPA